MFCGSSTDSNTKPSENIGVDVLPDDFARLLRLVYPADLAGDLGLLVKPPLPILLQLLLPKPRLHGLEALPLRLFGVEGDVDTLWLVPAVRHSHKALFLRLEGFLEIFLFFFV